MPLRLSGLGPLLAEFQTADTRSLVRKYLSISLRVALVLPLPCECSKVEAHLQEFNNNSFSSYATLWLLFIMPGVPGMSCGPSERVLSSGCFDAVYCQCSVSLDPPPRCLRSFKLTVNPSLCRCYWQRRTAPRGLFHTTLFRLI